MSAKHRQEFELLILQARYLRAQLEVDKKTYEESQKSFSESFNQRVKEILTKEQRESLEKVSKKKEIKKEKVPNDKIKQERKVHHPESIKKIYKGIARRSHPDKLVNIPEVEANIKKQLFREAQSAMEKQDFLNLFDIARVLDVELPEPEEGQIDTLEKNIKDIKNEIKQIKETSAWHWYHSLDEKKDEIMVRYIQHVYESHIK
jgi:hypothetical protein